MLDNGNEFIIVDFDRILDNSHGYIEIEFLWEGTKESFKRDDLHKHKGPQMFRKEEIKINVYPF